MLNHIKLIVRKNPDTVAIYTGTNDLTNGVKTINKVRNLVEQIRENDKDKSISIGFSSNCFRADRDLEKEINDKNGRLKNYCSNNAFIFI